MPSRSALRRKIMLTVTLNRCDGEEKQLVHTLDLTASSARIGGLTAVLDPGEIVELQHGEAKAKFQVVWMGTPDGAMNDQAGVRGVEGLAKVLQGNSPRSIQPKSLTRIVPQKENEQQ